MMSAEKSYLSIKAYCMVAYVKDKDTTAAFTELIEIYVNQDI